MIALVLAAQIVVPLALLLWVGSGSGRGATAIRTAAAALYLLGVWWAGLWVYPPPAALVLYSAGLAGAAILALRRSGAGRALAWSTALVAIVVAATGLALTWHGVAARQLPPGTLDLAFPLTGGRACVFSGGATPWFNLHMATLEAGEEKHRGQSYGVDLIAVAPSGFRLLSPHTLDLSPLAPERYAVFGMPVVAPCQGIVKAAENTLPDRVVGQLDRVNLAGNYVLLSCGAHEVLLAHLKQESVRVAAGAQVVPGQLLGAVGNSGNSLEPHLHIHAQRPAAAGHSPGSGDPVHLSFGGRFLSRGDCL